MKSATSAVARTDAMVPARMESAPRSGPTVRSSMTFSSTGSLPDRSRIASWLALSVVKLPEMMPDPPRIGSLMRGAEITCPSRMMAKGLPTFSCVALAKRLPPTPSKRNETTGMPSWKVGWLSTSWSPVISARRFTTSTPPSAFGTTWLPGGARPCAASAGSASVSTSLNSSFAVLPSRDFS